MDILGVFKKGISPDNDINQGKDNSRPQFCLRNIIVVYIVSKSNLHTQLEILIELY